MCKLPTFTQQLVDPADIFEPGPWVLLQTLAFKREKPQYQVKTHLRR